MKSILALCLLAVTVSAGISVKHRAFNASILNMDARTYAVDLENWRHGTHAYGYRAGDVLILHGSRMGYNGRVVVQSVVRDILIVRFPGPRSQRAEPSVRLVIHRISN